MADEKQTETKEKRTVPALVRTPRGVADHAAAVLEMQWDKERKSFKDPVTVMMALMSYAKLTPALLDESVSAANARATALEIRVEKLEQQITAFESWRQEVEAQSAEMARGFEAIMTSKDPMAALKEAIDTNNAPAVAPPVPPLPIIDVELQPSVEDGAAVVPIKPATEKSNKKPVEKNGGAA